MNKLLFHYTRAKSLFDILKDMSIKTSSFAKLNDLNEGNASYFWNISTYQAITIRELRKQCSMLSFSKSKKDEINELSGANRPNMWAHYAENSNGVCLIIDEDKFKEENKRIIETYNGKLEDVAYSQNNADSTTTIVETDIDEIYQKYYKELFFTKYNDWISEDERRIVLMNGGGEVFLSIKNSLVGVVMGPKFWNDTDSLCKLFAMISSKKQSRFRFLPTLYLSTFSYKGYGITQADDILRTHDQLDKQKYAFLNTFLNSQL